MDRNKGTGIGVGIGGSSILVIFILLCLTTFGTLSMVSARAGLRLTEKTALAAREYYDADAKAELLLADIDRVLPVTYNPAGDADEYLRAIVGVAPDAVVEPGDGDALVVRFTVPVNSNQDLLVELEVLPAVAGAHQYKRTMWKVISTSEWEPEPDGFELWGSDDDDLLPGNNLLFR